jgi:hypothetical protein
MDESLHIQHDIPGTEESPRGEMTRRESLKWLGVIAAGASLPLISGCDEAAAAESAGPGHWPDLKLQPISVEGYGTDPNLIAPGSPWPLTMTTEQRELTSVIADILVPREGENPSASEVNVTDVIDEWVSAPYPKFQSDRVEILSGLAWLDEESMRRFEGNFVAASSQQQLEIIDDIAFKKARSDKGFSRMAGVFDGLRRLVLTAYFSSPEGTKDIGYQGNIPLAGDYPGPTPEAMEHLDAVLQELDLADFSYS